MANPDPLRHVFTTAAEAEAAMDRLWWQVREATAALRKLGEFEQADECERLAFYVAAKERRWWKTWRKALSRCAYPDGREPPPKRLTAPAEQSPAPTSTPPTPKKRSGGKPRDAFARARAKKVQP